MRRQRTYALLLILVLEYIGLMQTGWAQAPGTIITVAGNGSYTFAGDGRQATNARLNNPYNVVVDRAGNLYITDQGNYRIRKVDTSGRIITVAGNGYRGFTGDGGPATQARLNDPRGVDVDGMGNLYIVDLLNQRIRKVEARGLITTVAGNGAYGFSGDKGPATKARLLNPCGAAVDGTGNLYIADGANQRIRKVDVTGRIITIAGNGEPGFSGDGGPATQARLQYPGGVTVDTIGNLYIVDTFNQRIRKVEVSGRITTIAGNGNRDFTGDGGPATQASLMFPTAVAVDGDGDLYIADQGNHRIRKVDMSGRITTVAGNGGFGGFSGDGGPATQASLNRPTGIAIDAALNLYVADLNNQRIRKVDATGVITTIAGGGAGDGGPATQAVLASPHGIAVDEVRNLYIADLYNHRIRKVDVSGRISTIAGIGVYGFSGDGGLATQARLNSPTGVAVDEAGNFYIADQGNYRIRKVDPTGRIITVAGNGVSGFSGDGGPATRASLGSPAGVAVDEAGNFYIADQGNYRIRKVDPTGRIITIAGNGVSGFSGDGGPATQARLDIPAGVTVDRAENLYIVDLFNYRIRKVNSNGIITTVAGNGKQEFTGDGGPAIQASLQYPGAVAVDRDGDLYIGDANRIRKVEASGRITTIAGNGLGGFSGDGRLAIQASLASSSGIALDRVGNLYIADQGNHRVRKVNQPLRVNVPSEFALEQNYPNPFNPETTIHFNLSTASTVTLRIYNLLGQEVATLINGEDKPAGYYTIRWNGRDGSGRRVASGVYFYRLTASQFSASRKMTLIR